METVIRDVGDLPPALRSAVESLVGHRVGEKGQVFLVLLDELTDEQRKRWDILLAAVAPFHKNVVASGASPRELEDEVDQAIANVRSGQG
jgi:hypothetical protein